MFSVEDFISRYEQYDDEELLRMHDSEDGYSDEAKKAVAILIEKRGGMDAIQQRQKKKATVLQERKRVEQEVAKLASDETNAEFVKKLVSSETLSKEEVEQIIDARFSQLEKDQKDKAITPRTVAGSIAGTVVAAIVGGTLWGLQIIYSGRVFYLFIIGLVLLCYGIIRLITRQSKNNTVVFFATIIATVLAVLFGHLLYTIFGYQG